MGNTEPERTVVLEEEGHGRFTALLVALVVLLLLPPLMPGVLMGRQIVTLAFLVVAVGAAFNVSRRKATLVLVTLMAVASLAAYGASLLWPETNAGRIVGLLFSTGLYLMALRGVAGEVFGARTVTVGTIRGALCIYILLGVVWASVYALVETSHPGSFSFPEITRVAPEGVDAPGRRTLGATGFFYYSFVTLTTLGYGDITPRTELARTLSWFEALVGQLFIAVTLARLVAVHVSRSLRDDP